MTAPVAQNAADVNWFQFAGSIICVVDQSTSDVGIGQLTSVLFNPSNGRYTIGLSSQEMHVNSFDQVTVTKVTATSNTLTLGIKAVMP